MLSIRWNTSLFCLVAVVISISGALNDPVPSYMVQINKKPGDTFLCAGAVIDSRHILTSATCIADYPLGSISVVGGATYQPSIKGLERNVFNVFTPSATGKPNPELDIAILKLISTMEGTNITTIPLATEEPKDSDTVEFVGLIETKDKTKPGVIKIPLISRTECMKKYGPYVVDIAETMMCGYGGSKLNVGNCYAPSGSPVVSNGEVVGVVTSAETCGYGKNPALMTNILQFQVFLGRSLNI